MWTKEDRIQNISTIPEGRMRLYTIEKNMTYVRVWKDDKGYHVDTSIKLNEKYDEDPGSILCGCPLQGRSHGHATAVFKTIEEAADACVNAFDKISHYQNPTYAKFQRVG